MGWPLHIYPSSEQAKMAQIAVLNVELGRLLAATLQRTRTKFGGPAFVVAGPAAWNRLPCSVLNSPSRRL